MTERGRDLAKTLGSIAANALSFTARAGLFGPPWEWTGKKDGVKLRKSEFYPRIVAHRNSLELAMDDWSVTWYFHVEERPIPRFMVDGCRIFQWPSDEAKMQGIIRTVLQSWWDAGLGEDIDKMDDAFWKKYGFLTENPGYKRFPRKTSTTKTAASEWRRGG